MFSEIMMSIVVYCVTHGGMRLGTAWMLQDIGATLDAIGVMALTVVGMFLAVVAIECIKAGFSKDGIAEDQLSGITLKVFEFAEMI